jgi:hypothetical protein
LFLPENAISVTFEISKMLCALFKGRKSKMISSALNSGQFDISEQLERFEETPVIDKSRVLSPDFHGKLI